MGRIKNPAGEFVLPTTKSITAAALGAKMRSDFRVSLTNAQGTDSYPITSFTWLYIPAKSKNPERRPALADYLRWIYAHAQKIAQHQGYASLPHELLTEVVDSLTG